MASSISRIDLPIAITSGHQDQLNKSVHAEGISDFMYRLPGY